MRIGLGFLRLALAAAPLLASSSLAAPSLAAPTPALPAPATTTGPFASPLTPELIDQGATVDWVDGSETSRAAFLPFYNARGWKNQVTWFLVVQGGHIGTNGITFGASTHAGPRHLRVGLLRAVPVGTVLTRGDIDRVAVLRADAAYPGDVARDADWIEATHQSAGELSLWVLPPGTSTRALRFTVDKAASAAPSGGVLLGASVLAGRVANLAPAAAVFASSHQGLAARLNGGAFNELYPWDNDEATRKEPVSPSRPEWVILSWPRRVSLRGLGLFFAFAGKAEAQVLTGFDAGHPREADESHWKTVAAVPLEKNYPETLVPAWLDFGRTVATRAVRVRLVAPVAPAIDHLPGRGSHDGKHVWLGQIMALEPLGVAPAPAPTPAAPPEAPRHPPIAVPFTMPEAGYATIVIEDARGRRVRNLVADTWFAAGRQVAWWDGLDESGRVEGPQHGAHGIYTTVGAPVAPGRYGVRGLFHGPLALSS